MSAPDWFLDAASSQGIEFDDGDLDQLERYLDLLDDANQRMNLTAIRDRDEAWRRHILDSLSLLAFLASADARRVADIGTGGGLPGIPLAITRPDIEFTLVDATGKKARFVESCADALGLSNVTVLNARAEDVGRDREHHREQYDLVVSRAVARLRVLLELTIPLAREGGVVLAVKGQQAADEIEEAKAALHTLHAAVVDTVRTETATIVVIEKLRKTGKMWPRRSGEPGRNPL